MKILPATTCQGTSAYLEKQLGLYIISYIQIKIPIDLKDGISVDFRCLILCNSRDDQLASTALLL